MTRIYYPEETKSYPHKLIKVGDNLQIITYEKPVKLGERFKDTEKKPRYTKKFEELTQREIEKKLERTRKRAYQLINHNFGLGTTFATLTFAEDTEETHDLKYCRAEFVKFLKRFRKKYDGKGQKKLKYLAVYERQQRGVWHFHIVWNRRIAHSDLEAIWGHGFVHIRLVKIFRENIAGYLLKYMLKALYDAAVDRCKAFYRSETLQDPVIAYSSNVLYFDGKEVIKTGNFNTDYHGIISYKFIKCNIDQWSCFCRQMRSNLQIVQGDRAVS